MSRTRLCPSNTPALWQDPAYHEAEALSGFGSWELCLPSEAGIAVSAEAARLLELRAEASQHRLEDALAALHPEDRREIAEAIADRAAFQLDVRIHSGCGRVRWVCLSAKTCTDLTAGETARFRGTIYDVTERKLDELMLIAAKEEADDLNGRLEQALADSARLTEQARAAERVKSQFLATMSHELRTPLNGIMGFTNLLRSSVLNEEQAEYVEAQLVNSEVLLDLITQVLEIAEIDAEEVESVSEPFSPYDLLEDLAEEFSPRAGSLSFGWSAAAPLPDYVLGDVSRLKRALRCLLDNAFKFTDRGSVELQARAVSAAGDTLCLRFDVVDTGIGVRPEDIERLFEDFRQLDATSTRRHGGSGLGLPLARRLCSMIDARIKCTSTLGEGSTFSIAVKVGRLSQPVPPKSGCDLSQSGQAIWIDCEHAVHARHLRSQLERLGVVTLHEGAPVQTANEEHMRLGLISRQDLHSLPATAERICACPQAAPDGLILLGPGDATARQAMARAAKVASVLPLPVRLHGLQRLLQPMLGPPALREHTEARPHPQKLNILLVEDNATNRKVASLLLKGMGHESILAENGLEGLRLLQDHAVDLVLMDLQMPVMDGIEAARRIRSGEAGNARSGIPILAVTANVDADSRRALLEAGINDYVAKPLKPEYLRTALGRLCPPA
ncbi:MAG: response regulator [Opitutales bacterium]